MKYKGLSNADYNYKTVPVPVKGLDLNNTENRDDEYCDKATNVILDGNLIKTRPGIDASAVDEILFDTLADAQSIGFKDSGFFVGEAEAKKRLYYAFVDYDETSSFIAFYLLSVDGSVEAIGNIPFSQLDETTYYKPISVTVFAGSPQTGGGIFAFVTLKDRATDNCEYRVYEIDDDFEDWEVVYGFYIPTVYINGRGTLYERAVDSGYQISKLKPTALESPNMLYPRFNAYYTSDGFSSSFRLPYNDIDSGASVTCRIWSNLTNYSEWIILPNETVAETAFYGQQIKCRVDRQTGTVYFLDSDGLAFAVPVMDLYGDNNIRISASKTEPGAFSNVISCDCAEKAGDKIVFSGGNAKNSIFYCDFENPLYFPRVYSGKIGSEDEKTTALKVTDSGLLALKEDKIYRVSIGGEKVHNITALLADNGKIFKSTASFEVKLIFDGLGGGKCVCIDGRPVVVTADGIVAIPSDGKRVFISKEVEPFLKEILSGEITASAVGGKLYLFCENKGLIIDFENGGNDFSVNNIGRYIWELPNSVRIVGITDFNRFPVFIIRNRNSDYFYTAKLCGTVDKVLDNLGNVVTKRFKSSFLIKNIRLTRRGQFCRISSVVLGLSAKGGVLITVESDTEKRNFPMRFAPFSSFGTDNVRLLCDSNPTDSIGIGITSEGSFTFSGADVYYH